MIIVDAISLCAPAHKHIRGYIAPETVIVESLHAMAAPGLAQPTRLISPPAHSANTAKTHPVRPP
jgi:hypothetical protein